MKRNVIALVALSAGFALAGAAYAQARHDEKPHGYDAAKAQTTMDTDKAKAESAPAAGGRHDEKPHNTKKAKTAAKAAPKATDDKAKAEPAASEAAKPKQ